MPRPPAALSLASVPLARPLLPQQVTNCPWAHVCTYKHTHIHTYTCTYLHRHIHAYMHTHIHETRTYMLSGPGLPHPPPHGIPPPFPGPRPLCPRAPEPPLLPAVPHNRNEPTQTRERGRWRMIPASASSQERRTASEQGQGHRLQGEKSNIIFCMVTSMLVTMTLLLTSGSNHTIHIFVEHTAPHRRGGANQNDHRPHPTGGEGTRHVTMTLLLTSPPYHTSVEHTAPPQAGRGQPRRPQAPLHRGGGGRDEARQDQTGKATWPNKTTTHLTGKGGYHGVGGGRGGVAALHHI